MFEEILTRLSIPSQQYYMFKVKNTATETLEQDVKYVQK